MTTSVPLLYVLQNTNSEKKKSGVTQGRAPNGYKDIPIFMEYHTSSGRKEEDPIDEQIC